jgi:hypothetical protein
MATPDLDRLTILERAQLLHDATLRRHGEMLDQLEEARVQHEQRMAHLTSLMEGQQANQTALQEIAEQLRLQQAVQLTRLDRHEDIMLRLAQTLDAIKDLLERRNGRS